MVKKHNYSDQKNKLDVAIDYTYPMRQMSLSARPPAQQSAHSDERKYKQTERQK